MREPNLWEASFFQARYLFALDADAAGCWTQNAPDHRKQSRLTASGWPHEHGHFAAVNVQVNTIDRMNSRFAGFKYFSEIPHRNGLFAHLCFEYQYRVDARRFVDRHDRRADTHHNSQCEQRQRDGPWQQNRSLIAPAEVHDCHTD